MGRIIELEDDDTVFAMHSLIYRRRIEELKMAWIKINRRYGPRIDIGQSMTLIVRGYRLLDELLFSLTVG